MQTPSELITAYLAASGWTGAELARRADLSHSAITRLLRGRKTRESVTFSVGELVALKIERATVDAFTRRETNATPLRAADLIASAKAAA